MNRQPTVRQVLADAVETLIDVLDLSEMGV